eukprot:992316_1
MLIIITTPNHVSTHTTIRIDLVHNIITIQIHVIIANHINTHTTKSKMNTTTSTSPSTIKNPSPKQSMISPTPKPRNNRHYNTPNKHAHHNYHPKPRVNTYNNTNRPRPQHNYHSNTRNNRKSHQPKRKPTDRKPSTSSTSSTAIITPFNTHHSLYPSPNTVYSIPYQPNINMLGYPMQNVNTIQMYPTNPTMIYSHPLMLQRQQQNISNVFYTQQNISNNNKIGISNRNTNVNTPTNNTPKPSMQSMIKGTIKLNTNKSKNISNEKPLKSTDNKVKFSFNKTIIKPKIKTEMDSNMKAVIERTKHNINHRRKQRNFSSDDDDTYANNICNDRDRSRDSVTSYTSSSSYSYTPSMDDSYSRGRSATPKYKSRNRNRRDYNNRNINRHSHRTHYNIKKNNRNDRYRRDRRDRRDRYNHNRNRKKNKHIHRDRRDIRDMRE